MGRVFQWVGPPSYHRHPEVRAERASKGDGQDLSNYGLSSFEARPAAEHLRMTNRSIPQIQHLVLPPIRRRRRGQPVAGDALHQHVAAVAGGLRPCPDGAVLGVAAPQHVLRRGRGQRSRPRAKRLVVEMVAAGEIVGVGRGLARQRGAERQRRQSVLRAEGIEVEGGGGEGQDGGTHDSKCDGIQ
jgi:hypothetical protein